jgi:phage terminase small subunit
MLTQKQEAFCLAYIETGNASEAYRRAYNAGKMKPATVNRKAKRLMDMGKIGARIEGLFVPLREAAQVTIESHLRDLMKLRDEAQAQRQFSAAINAEIARGKAAGLYVTKQEVTAKGELTAEIPVPYCDLGKLTNEELETLEALLAKAEYGVQAPAGLDDTKTRGLGT